MQYEKFLLTSAESTRSEGLSRDDILVIIRDDAFQKSIKLLFNNRDYSLFKGLGFLLAVIAGIFGYYLKEDSMAADRRAQIVHNIIKQKSDRLAVAIVAGMDMRNTRFEIEQECKLERPLTKNRQFLKRYQARDRLIRAFSGISEVFSPEVFDAFVELIKFDVSIKDICSARELDDEVWRLKLAKAIGLMTDSIRRDREDLGSVLSSRLAKFAGSL